MAMMKMNGSKKPISRMMGKPAVNAAAKKSASAPSPVRGAAINKKPAKPAMAPKLMPSQIKTQKAETKRETMALSRGIKKPKPMPARKKGK